MRTDEPERGSGQDGHEGLENFFQRDSSDSDERTQSVEYYHEHPRLAKGLTEHLLQRSFGTTHGRLTI